MAIDPFEALALEKALSYELNGCRYDKYAAADDILQALVKDLTEKGISPEVVKHLKVFYVINTKYTLKYKGMYVTTIMVTRTPNEDYSGWFNYSHVFVNPFFDVNNKECTLTQKLAEVEAIENYRANAREKALHDLECQCSDIMNKTGMNFNDLLRLAKDITYNEENLKEFYGKFMKIKED